MRYLCLLPISVLIAEIKYWEHSERILQYTEEPIYSLEYTVVNFKIAIFVYAAIYCVGESESKLFYAKLMPISAPVANLVNCDSILNYSIIITISEVSSK